MFLFGVGLTSSRDTRYHVLALTTLVVFEALLCLPLAWLLGTTWIDTFQTMLMIYIVAVLVSANAQREG